jgi:hypothetical protein
MHAPAHHRTDQRCDPVDPLVYPDPGGHARAEGAGRVDRATGERHQGDVDHNQGERDRQEYRLGFDSAAAPWVSRRNNLRA